MFRRSDSRKCTDIVVTLPWTCAMWLAMLSMSSGSSSLISERKRFATAISASFDHAWNQSIWQQLTSAGNWRARTRKVSPT